MLHRSQPWISKLQSPAQARGTAQQPSAPKVMAILPGPLFPGGCLVGCGGPARVERTASSAECPFFWPATGGLPNFTSGTSQADVSRHVSLDANQGTVSIVSVCMEEGSLKLPADIHCLRKECALSGGPLLHQRISCYSFIFELHRRRDHIFHRKGLKPLSLSYESIQSSLLHSYFWWWGWGRWKKTGDIRPGLCC